MGAKNKKILLSLRNVLVVTLVYFSCTGKPANEIPETWKPLINNNLEYHKNKLYMECRNKALEEAEKIVDSLLIEQAIKLGQDSIQIPEKPIKPEKPEPKIPRDTSRIDPLLHTPEIPAQ